MTLRNEMVSGVEVAPKACIVCGKPAPEGQSNVPGWSYLAGSKPVGAVTCSASCRDKAIDRHRRTGRVDTPAMRAQRN